VSLKGLHLNDYRSYLGQSLSEESPFEGTLEDNITFGDSSVSSDDIYWALEKTGLTQFVKEQPKGIKTVIYPEGKQIPYTVSKKIVLARSIIRRPKLLILKDPLNQFDEREANEIMRFLTDPINGWALLVVSQNPKWMEGCSRIITIENGKIINEN
jgi:ABC-type bacteriocin/lantibiotic exporter with double-glycine peptidase domain